MAAALAPNHGHSPSAINVLLSQEAVLAAGAGALPHLLPQSPVHAAPASFFL